MTTISNPTASNNSNTDYRHQIKNSLIGGAGVVAAWEAEPYIKKGIMYPTRKYIKNQFKTVSGGGYKPYAEKAVKLYNLENEFKLINLNPQNCDKVAKTLKATSHPEPKGFEKFLLHILRFPNDNKKVLNAVKNGQNAFFSPADNAVVCNFDKFGSPVFHEIGHKLNSKSKNIIVNALSKIRNPLSVFGTLFVSGCAIFKNPINKKGQRKTFTDFVKENCGLVATACMLPLTVEECIASIKGTKIAKKTGVSGDMLKKVVKCHKLSAFSYCCAAIGTGLAVHFVSKLRDGICNLKN